MAGVSGIPDLKARGDSQDLRQEEPKDPPSGTGIVYEKDEGVVIMGKRLSQLKAELMVD
jgi:hypothetical protein